MKFDLLTIGRCSLDLFSEQIGADFVDIQSFDTQVGGSPTNIAIGARRLGLHTATVTAVGADPVGDFVRSYLAKEGVATDFVFTKNGRTPLAVLGVQPPSNFPLVFYRENPPDQFLTIDDIKTLPLNTTKMVLIAGSNFASPTLRDASLFAAQQSTTTIIDIDLRPSLWDSPDALSQNMQTLFPHCQVIIGTEEELWAALSNEPDLVWQGKPVLENERPTLDKLIQKQIKQGQTIILKRGPRGVTIFESDQQPQDIAGFPVEVINTVGAGDAFASGLIYGRIQGWNWNQAARFANACGAIVVTRHGCSAAMPTLDEVQTFIKTNHPLEGQV